MSAARCAHGWLVLETMSPPSSADELIDESSKLERAGRIGDALQRALAALEQARTVGDPKAECTALNRVGMLHFRLGHYEQACAMAKQALALAAPYSRSRFAALVTIGNCALETNSLTEAQEYFLRALDASREIGDDWGRFIILHNLALVYLYSGRLDLALAADKEAYSLAQERNLQEWLYYPLVTLAWNYCLMGQTSDARAATAELKRVVSPGSIFEGYCLYLEAWQALDDGDAEAVLAQCNRARSIAEVTGDPRLNVLVRLLMSRYYRESGDSASAWTWADDGVAFAARVGPGHERGRTLLERGRAAWLNGDETSAENDLRAAIHELSARGQLYDLARAHLVLAAFLHAQNRADAESAWLDAARQITHGGYAVILDQDRALAYPLIAAHLNSANPGVAPISQQCIEHLQRVPPPPLRIVMFGTFEVRQGARQVDRRMLRKRRAGELLALLLLAPSHALTFDQIADALWADKDPAAAQMLFHHATSALRRALEPELPDKFPSRYLLVEEGQVTLDLPPDSTIDCETFAAHCQREDWDAALAAYRGDLLPDHLYADWSIAPRERLKRFYLRALLVTAHRQMKAGRAREALDACHRILDIDPWQEDAVLLGMRACLAFNDRAGALRLYRALEKALREELGTTPLKELQALYQSLLKTKDEG